MKVYDVVAATLSGHGPVFGLMGDANLAYLGALMEHQAGRFVGAVAEGGAVSMADGYHRASGDIGIASVTHGPALTNCVTALTEAVRARSHVLLLTGDTPDYHDHFQRIDIQAVASLTGAAYLRAFDPDRIADDLRRALDTIQAQGRPLILDIPAALLERESACTLRGHSTTQPRPPAPHADAVDDALGMLLSSDRPLILAGRGAAGAGDVIADLAALLGAPVSTTLLAKDLFGPEVVNIGIHGTLAHQVGAQEIAAADCVLVLGASLNSFTTDSGHLLDGKAVIQCDIRADALGRFGPITLGIVADVQTCVWTMLARLTEHGQQPPHSRRLADLRQRLAALDPTSYVPLDRVGTADPRDIMRALNTLLPIGTEVVTDIGRFTRPVWRHIGTRAGHFHVTSTFGSIGLGLATAVGASAARPDRVTAVFVGDGGAMMSIAELSTAVRELLPLVVVVSNDTCYGAEWAKLLQVGLEPELACVDWPSFAEVGTSLGAQTIRITGIEDLHLVEDALARRAFPLLVEVMTDPSTAPTRC